jgi:hypothetical protein
VKVLIIRILMPYTVEAGASPSPEFRTDVCLATPLRRSLSAVYPRLELEYAWFLRACPSFGIDCCQSAREVMVHETCTVGGRITASRNIAMSAELPESDSVARWAIRSREIRLAPSGGDGGWLRIPGLEESGSVGLRERKLPFGDACGNGTELGDKGKALSRVKC